MNQADTPILVPANHGDPFEGGLYGGQIRIGDHIFGIAWAPKAMGEIKGKWLDRYERVPGAISCFDSMANTKAMAEAGSDIAKQALAADINGFTDWCIPARDVLELGYRHLKPGSAENYAGFRDGDNPSSLPAGYPYTEDSPGQTMAAEFQDGGPEAFEQRWYWASTQYSETTAWCQDFSTGGQGYYGKNGEFRVRFVRLIQLSA